MYAPVRTCTHLYAPVCTCVAYWKHITGCSEDKDAVMCTMCIEIEKAVSVGDSDRKKRALFSLYNARTGDYWNGGYSIFTLKEAVRHCSRLADDECRAAGLTAMLAMGE